MVGVWWVMSANMNIGPINFRDHKFTPIHITFWETFSFTAKLMLFFLFFQQESAAAHGLCQCVRYFPSATFLLIKY
jgi:hypothetical protein